MTKNMLMDAFAEVANILLEAWIARNSRKSPTLVSTRAVLGESGTIVIDRYIVMYVYRPTSSVYHVVVTDDRAICRDYAGPTWLAEAIIDAMNGDADPMKLFGRLFYIDLSRHDRPADPDDTFDIQKMIYTMKHLHAEGWYVPTEILMYLESLVTA